MRAGSDDGTEAARSCRYKTVPAFDVDHATLQFLSTPYDEHASTI